MTPAKKDILCHRALEAIEVAHAGCDVYYNANDPNPERRAVSQERIARLGRGSSQFLARVLNSDAHTLKAVGRNANRDQRITRYKMESPSFQGLLLAMRSADTRVRIEELLPATVPIVHGVHFEGGFLNSQGIRFSPNLTCIIGGRGSGKSTAFESVCLIGGAPPMEATVVDSDVWANTVALAYRDHTGQLHNLARSKGDDIENIDDPFLGATSFPIDSYRQGATNDISKQVQDDPLALLTFLDRLIDIEPAIAEEEQVRQEMMELAPKLDKARAQVAKIPQAERDLALKAGQLKRLRDDKGEEVITLQQQLEAERRTRAAIETELGQLSSAVSDEAIVAIANGIRESLDDHDIQLGAPEATTIREATDGYKQDVGTATTSLRQVTAAYVAKVKAQVTAWKAKEAQTTSQIEQKKQELLKHGIRLDMPSIQKLISDEARAREAVKNLNLWNPELVKLERQYADLRQRRWARRSAVASTRDAFARRASSALRSALSDIFVSLKYEASALSPDAEEAIVEVMGWRTLQHLKARALVGSLTVPTLLECVRRSDTKSITDLRNSEGGTIFSASEAQLLFERIAEPTMLARLESIAVHDRPRLTVTKRIDEADGQRYIPRDFKKLSLGQQQSVLLALMLTSESNAPLIVDQPEDNLDSEFIYKTLVPAIRAAKERRQVIVVTHNANIAILGDAELIVVLKATSDQAKVVTRGSIDHPPTCELACAILEGSREAFDRRAQVYGVAKPT